PAARLLLSPQDNASTTPTVRVTSPRMARRLSPGPGEPPDRFSRIVTSEPSSRRFISPPASPRSLPRCSRARRAARRSPFPRGSSRTTGSCRSRDGRHHSPARPSACPLVEGCHRRRKGPLVRALEGELHDDDIPDAEEAVQLTMHVRERLRIDLDRLAYAGGAVGPAVGDADRHVGK